ncbi:response regulator [Phenylobacterium sp.]|jgi:CheY-like chemotaxis protein|uniref:response regulator n=1 Tax=Phenylobacterium sp. TaxID=1871053 RepID=UPI002F425F54
MSPLPQPLRDRISDEIRQQMDGVLALADRMARHSLSPDAQACVAGVAEAAGAVLEIMNRARDLENADGPGLTLTQAPRRLRELIDEIQDRWQERAALNGVTLLVAYDGDPEACALVDGPRLLQLFDGLIGEAVAGVRRGAVEASLKVSSHGETLHLEGRVRGGERDGGADLEEIEARYGLQTALGVTLGHRVLEAFGGDLRREANTGAGATVVFEFDAEPAPAAKEAHPEAADAQRTAHVLVVDDNATNRMVAQTLCEMFDCTSESADDGVEAVEAAQTGRFDLILMDIKMPRMDGVAATKAIRALSGRPGRVPIIALTANADPEDAAAYVSAGMNGVVEKPMKPENLLHALQQALAEAGAAEAA